MKINLYKLVQKSKSDNKALESLIKRFEPKIKKSLALTHFSERDDLEQELKLKLATSIRDYELDSVPGFWEFRQMQVGKK